MDMSKAEFGAKIHIIIYIEFQNKGQFFNGTSGNF